MKNNLVQHYRVWRYIPALKDRLTDTFVSKYGQTGSGYKLKELKRLIADSQQALSQLCDRCEWCSSSFPRPRASNVPQTPRLPYGITQYYPPPETGEPVRALYMGWGTHLRILLP